MAETTYAGNPADRATIPSGVAPGAKALYTPKYTPPSTLNYPENLGSAERNHMVVFKIFEIKPLIGTPSLVNVEAAALGRATSFTTAAISGNPESAGASTGTVNNPRQQNKYGFNWNAPTEYNPSTTIGIYMPDTLNFVQNAQYDNLSIADAISEFPGLGQPAKAIFSTLSGTTVTRGVLANIGVVFNPQEQLLFEGIDFRTFDMSFTMTPRTKNESEMVKKIVYQLRYHSAPEINSGTAGFFFTPPSVFEIMFMSNGVENENLPKLKRCVLETVDVNYAPNGWAAHEIDGAPVQTSLQMRFKEILLIDKNEIAKGF